MECVSSAMPSEVVAGKTTPVTMQGYTDRPSYPDRKKLNLHATSPQILVTYNNLWPTIILPSSRLSPKKGSPFLSLSETNSLTPWKWMVGRGFFPFWDDGFQGEKRVVSGEDTTSTTTTFFRRSKIVSDSLRGGCQRLRTIQKSCQVGCIMHTEGRHLLKRWWFEAFWIFTPNPGEMFLFDSYFLQVGWNHQLVLHMIWVILLMVQESGYITSWYGEYLIFHSSS